MPTSTLLISENLAGRMPDLAARYPQVRFVELPLEGGELRDEYRAADAMFRSAMDERLFDQILDATPKLRWVQISAAGFDWMGGDVLSRRIADGMVVTRSGNSLNVTMAEYCIGAMIGAARQMPAFAGAQQRAEWVSVMGRDFTGSTVAIFGTGAIGAEVAWRAAALGARPVGVNRTGAPAAHFDDVVSRHEFMPLLAEADYVVLAMPLTPETDGMFGTAQFAAMPSHAVLVNVGRGALTDEAALMVALETGEIAYAYLDVFVEEPLPADHPLWRTRNAIITPHTSYRSAGTSARMAVDFTANLDRFLAGEPLAGTMKHPELGY